jgi:hypothetical protein
MNLMNQRTPESSRQRTDELCKIQKLNGSIHYKKHQIIDHNSFASTIRSSASHQPKPKIDDDGEIELAAADEGMRRRWLNSKTNMAK